MEKTITLTERQRENLINFMQRLNLKGHEVPAYIEIVGALNKPFLDEIKIKEKEDVQKKV